MSQLKLNAEQVLARRVLMRRRLMPYVRHYRPQYKAGWVHELICRRLERFSQDVVDEKSPRVMLLVPPRHGKSTLVSEEFPGWHLGRVPTHEFISASYNISLPTGFSRKIRARLRDAEYQALFADAQLDPDSQSVEQWLLTKGGGYLAAGVGGGITGKGAHILSIDDPVKNAEEADSIAVLDAIWDWYGSTAYTRLAPGGGVLITQTWWSEGDLAGRIQDLMREDHEFDQFEIIKFPAIAEEDEYLTTNDTIWRASDGTDQPDDAQLLRRAGDALHPERYSLAALLKIRKTTQPRHWSALYQQNPVPDDGLYFTKEMFVPLVSPLPGERHIYQAWDFAITEKQSADWTVGVTGGLDYDDNIEAIDQQRFRTGDSARIVDAMLDGYEKWRPLLIGVETGQIWKTMRTYFEKRCLERKLYPMIVELTPITDKAARARPLQGRMAQGKVKWNHDAPWFEATKREFLRFQAGGIHDDQVDAWAWLAHLIVGQAAPRRPEPKKDPSWRDRMNEFMQGADVSHMAA
jgi:phage terminase large subunit-like protein